MIDCPMCTHDIHAHFRDLGCGFCSCRLTPDTLSDMTLFIVRGGLEDPRPRCEKCGANDYPQYRLCSDNEWNGYLRVCKGCALKAGKDNGITCSECGTPGCAEYETIDCGGDVSGPVCESCYLTSCEYDPDDDEGVMCG